MKKLITLFFMLVFLCSFSQQASSEPKGTLVVGMEAETYSMDPLAAWMTYGIQIMRQMYDCLVEFSPKGELIPALAVSWRPLDDKTWRFNLRKGVKFHNGDPFSAADVKFSIERLLDPKNKCVYRSRFASIDKLIIIDDHTIDLKMKTPNPLILKRLAFFGRIVSKKFVDENGIETLRKHAMGTGPFKFVSWKRKERLTMEANTDWYLATPKVKNLIIRAIPEMSARMSELMAGGVHIVTIVPPFMVAKLKEHKDTDVVSVPAVRATFLLMNTLKVEELKDKRVRQALNYAVDKEAIIKGLLSGFASPVGINAPMYLAGVDQSIKPYPYDPSKAKALLKEAGYPNGFSLNLYSPAGRFPMDKEIMQAVADQLSKVGIKPEVHVVETGKYFKDWLGKRLEGVFMVAQGFIYWAAEAMYTFVDPASSYCEFHNKTLEEMAKEISVTMDSEKRRQLNYKIQNMIHDEAPGIFMYSWINNFGLSKNVKGFKARGDDDHLELWRVSVAE